MRSIFDDEDNLYGYASQLGPMVKHRVGIMPIPAVQPTVQIAPSPKKRTVNEALHRLYDAAPPDFETIGLYGLVRATRKPFAIYNLARLGAAGLVIIDPLNRLEGGLID